MENDIQTNWCIIAKGNWCADVTAYKQGLETKTVMLILCSTLCIWHTSLGAELMEQKNKQAVKFFFFLHSEHLCVTMLTACLVAPESKKSVGNEQVQIEISIISCLITSQIAIFRQDKSVPSCFESFRLNCFILCLTEKAILWVVLANRVIQKWPITYTNMTKLILTEGPIFPIVIEASHIYMIKTYSSTRSTYIYSLLPTFYLLESNIVLLCSPNHPPLCNVPQIQDTTARARSSHYAKYWIFNGSLQSAIFLQRFCQYKQVE